ncbi:Condensin-2 complex subunit [Trichinella pseudospiralis]
MRLQIWLSSLTATPEPLHSFTPTCSPLSVALLRQSCLKTVKGSRSVGALKMKMRSGNSEKTSSRIPLKASWSLLSSSVTFCCAKNKQIETSFGHDVQKKKPRITSVDYRNVFAFFCYST